VFGGDLPPKVLDTTPATPQGSYGAQKAMCELMVTDYSRKGFVDGSSLRLPTVTVRPGKANKAASSFASGIIREPLNGVVSVCPVPPETKVWALSPRSTVHNLIHAHELDSAAFGSAGAVNLPGLTTTVGEMVAAMGRVAGGSYAGGRSSAGLLTHARKPTCSRCSWPLTMRCRTLVAPATSICALPRRTSHGWASGGRQSRL
jgi:nucleoside-diphosphate-sugar epimerase